MRRTIAILIFDGVEEMDFVGPLEVLAAAAESEQGWRVTTVAETLAAIRCEKGMRVLPECTHADIDNADVVIIPGGSGARREIENPATITWLLSLEPRCHWIASVCTGAFLLAGSGLAAGRRITTHHEFIEKLRGTAGAEVVEGVRFVRDGRIVSAAGVMSGNEMSLWMVGQIWEIDAAERAKSYIAYNFPERSRSADGR